MNCEKSIPQNQLLLPAGRWWSCIQVSASALMTLGLRLPQLTRNIKSIVTGYGASDIKVMPAQEWERKNQRLSLQRTVSYVSFTFQHATLMLNVDNGISDDLIRLSSAVKSEKSKKVHQCVDNFICYLQELTYCRNRREPHVASKHFEKSAISCLIRSLTLSFEWLLSCKSTRNESHDNMKPTVPRFEFQKKRSADQIHFQQASLTFILLEMFFLDSRKPIKTRYVWYVFLPFIPIKTCHCLSLMRFNAVAGFLAVPNSTAPMGLPSTKQEESKFDRATFKFSPHLAKVWTRRPCWTGRRTRRPRHRFEHLWLWRTAQCQARLWHRLHEGLVWKALVQLQLRDDASWRCVARRALSLPEAPKNHSRDAPADPCIVKPTTEQIDGTRHKISRHRPNC